MGGYFENKVAAVTGAASGIGLEISEQVLSRGGRAVFMADVKEENLTRTSRAGLISYSIMQGPG
jgi:NAD(P)-dependent dehydrogenase (short-subunit alcohol dehydrogenase family)